MTVRSIAPGPLSRQAFTGEHKLGGGNTRPLGNLGTKRAGRAVTHNAEVPHSEMREIEKTNVSNQTKNETPVTIGDLIGRLRENSFDIGKLLANCIDQAKAGSAEQGLLDDLQTLQGKMETRENALTLLELAKTKPGWHQYLPEDPEIIIDADGGVEFLKACQPDMEIIDTLRTLARDNRATIIMD